MASLLLPDLSAAPLQAMSRASMRHRVALETLESIRFPNGEYQDAWVAETEQPGSLKMGGASAAELAAARGVVARGTLRLELGKTCTPGQRAMIRGVTRGVAWQRLVEVTSGTDLTSRLFGLATVVDVDLNA
jgi:hypothetical protein